LHQIIERGCAFASRHVDKHRYDRSTADVLAYLNTNEEN